MRPAWPRHAPPLTCRARPHAHDPSPHTHSCSFRADVDSFCQDEARKGQAVSANTLAAGERLARAQLLVQSLGGAVCQPPGMMG